MGVVQRKKAEGEQMNTNGNAKAMFSQCKYCGRMPIMRNYEIDFFGECSKVHMICKCGLSHVCIDTDECNSISEAKEQLIEKWNALQDGEK